MAKEQTQGEPVQEALAKRVLEALLFISDKSLQLEQARAALGPGVDTAEIRRWLTELSEQYAREGRGLRVLEVAEGFQMVTDPELFEYVSRLTHRVKTVRLTRPALETLAIVAYRQPITRVEIEQVRGVDASGVLDTLLKFSLIRMLGRKEVVGRPMLYGTTREFLDHFGLKSVDDLPSLEELKNLTKESETGATPGAAQAPEPAAQQPQAAPDEARNDPQPTAQTD